MLGYLTSVVKVVDDEFINMRENLISWLVVGIKTAQDHLTLVSEPLLLTSLGQLGETRLTLF